MGVSMEFYAGDPGKIGPAFTAVELEGLRDGSLAHAYADFSLHLSPDHLDLLSEHLAVTSNQPPVLLLESLGAHIGGTEDESSAELVSSPWVTMVAGVPSEAVPTIAKRWMAAVAEDCGDPSIESSSNVENALLGLIHLCRDARDRETSVVFAWYL